VCLLKKASYPGSLERRGQLMLLAGESGVNLQRSAKTGLWAVVSPVTGASVIIHQVRYPRTSAGSRRLRTERRVRRCTAGTAGSACIPPGLPRAAARWRFAGDDGEGLWRNRRAQPEPRGGTAGWRWHNGWRAVEQWEMFWQCTLVASTLFKHIWRIPMLSSARPQTSSMAAAQL
jgi:hypothetical protein